MRIDPISSLLHRHAGSHGAAMLMYHAVQPGPASPSWPWAVSLSRFCAQLDFLQVEGYETLTMANLAANPRTASKRSVVITFDDGYVDNLAAMEALLKRGMRATWFIVSGSIGTEPGWKADGRPAGRLLNANELREMNACGMEIGSHTVSHLRLPTLGAEDLERELTESRASLEDCLGTAVSSFAYPYGAWDMRCVAAVREAGYSAACTTRTGWALRDRDPLTLRRLTVFNTDTTGSLARKLYFGSHDVSWTDIAGYALRRLKG